MTENALGEMPIADALQPAIARVQGAIRQFTNGDPGPYKACWSQAADVTIFGGWGAYERGWAQVERRLEWAAARWRGGLTDFDLLAEGASGALAYTIWIETGSARLAGSDEYRRIVLRVTHLYRQEGDSWRVVHRHADALNEITPVEAILLDTAPSRRAVVAGEAHAEHTGPRHANLREAAEAETMKTSVQRQRSRGGSDHA